MRWIRRSGRFHVQMYLLISKSRRIAVPVGVVVCGTTGCEGLAPGRLGELPNLCEIDATLRRTKWRIWERASRRRRTYVISHEVLNSSAARILSNVIGGDDGSSIIFFGGDSGTINAGAKTCGGDSIDPGVDVGFLLRQHASTLFLIEKNYGSRRKALMASRHDGSMCVRSP